MPYFLATCAVASWLPPTSDVSSTSGMRLSASRCFCPKAPCPATQIFITHLSELPVILAVFQRHGRACPGHPRLCAHRPEDVDARHKAGHDARIESTADAVHLGPRRGAFELA